MKITIRRAQLIAALHTAADQDIRHYLNGVLVEATATQTRLASTNGHILSVQRHDEENQIAEPVTLIIPRNIVAMIKAHKFVDWLDLEKRDDEMWALLDRGTQSGEPIAIPFQPVDGTFPDYRRVIPDKVNGQPAYFNPDYIAAFAKAAKVLGATDKKSPVVNVTCNGTGDGTSGAALVSIGRDEEYIGVIMPIRWDVVTEAPAWAKTRLEMPATLAA